LLDVFRLQADDRAQIRARIGRRGMATVYGMIGVPWAALGAETCFPRFVKKMRRFIAVSGF
jgi:hypothetical protein